MKATIPDRRPELSSFSDYSDNEQSNGIHFREENIIGKYREAIIELQRKCEFLSQNNERLVRRFV